jgi:hypothetical protein
MIGHQEFEDGFARFENFFGTGRDIHVRFDRTDTRSRENAGSGVYYAEAANADRGFVLQMTEGGNEDSV